VVFSEGSGSATRFHRRTGSTADKSASLDAGGGGDPHAENVKPLSTAVNRVRWLQFGFVSFEASLRAAPQDEEMRPKGAAKNAPKTNQPIPVGTS
jgi:hypothetical protein